MRSAARYQAKREFLLAQVTAYYHENQIEIRDRRHRRRQCDGQDVCEGTETVAYMRMIVADPCAYCGTVSTTDDHIVPLSTGGEHHWMNMTRACLSCNSRKHARSLLQWLLVRMEAV